MQTTLPPSPQSNEPLPPKQIEMLRAGILDCYNEIESTNNILCYEKRKIAVRSAAVAHLDPVITRAKHAETLQVNLLASLINMKEQVNEFTTTIPPDLTEDSEAKEICGSTMTNVDDQVRSISENLAAQVSQIETNLSVLRASIREMEQDMYSQTLTNHISTQRMSDTRSYQEKLENAANLLKSRLNHVKITPAEIWSNIFCIIVHGEWAEYLKEPPHVVMPSSAVTLAQVCRRWRQMAFAEQRLWAFLPMNPRKSIEILRAFESLNNQPTTFVCDLARMRGRYYPVPTPVLIDPNDISKTKPYSLRIIHPGDTPHTAPRSLLPYNCPESLTVRLLRPGASQLNSLLSACEGYTSLEIIGSDTLTGTLPPLATSQPQLRSLRLDLAYLGPPNVVDYLGANLTEFHTLHHGFETLPPFTTIVRLPRLKTIGLPPSEAPLLHSLDLPVLSSLVIYGPKDGTADKPSLVMLTTSSNFERVRVLVFQNWNQYHPLETPKWGVTRPMGGIIDKMRSVVSLKCIDSYISGRHIVDHIKELKSTTAMENSALETVVINRCSGITRADCEAIGELVGKLEVYV